MRNPKDSSAFDFTDPEHGDLREFFDNGMSKEEKLVQI